MQPERLFYVGNCEDQPKPKKTKTKQKKQTHLGNVRYSLAALPDETGRTGARVHPVRFYAESSIYTAEFQTVIHLVLAFFPSVSRFAVTLVVSQQVFAGPVNTGTWGTLIYLRLTHFALPPCTTAAVKLIKLILTRPQVKTWQGITNGTSLTSSGWLASTQSGELGHLRGFWNIEEGQIDPTHSHFT